MSATYMNRPYILGFAKKSIAQDVSRYVNDCKGTYVEKMELNSSATIRMKKKININYLSCHVADLDLEKYLCIPFAYNVGLAIVFDVCEETKDDYLFDSFIVDPLVRH